VIDHAKIVRARWWLCIPVALLCLVLVDAALRLWWHPHPGRLPEQFSAAYLQRYVDDERGRAPVVVLGDSVLWGYKLPAPEAAATLLASRIAPRPLINLSYEGGSSANSYFMLRYVLSRGIRPSLVVLGVNSKETNEADSAYNRLEPALERDVLPLMDASDRKLLVLSATGGLPIDLEQAVERVWLLYRYRTDIREQLFGTDDASLAFRDLIQRLTGSAALQAADHRPTADKFLGTYDLGPLTSDNVDAKYLKALADLLRSNHIPTVAFLTPTNHQLLADYINAPEYDAKLHALSAILRRDGISVLDLDRSMRGSEFIDNDHLTEKGNEHLATSLYPYVAR
jgi:hypothetical protein